MPLNVLRRECPVAAFGVLGIALVVAACGGEAKGTPTPFSLGGGSRVEGFTPTPTAAPLRVTPAAPKPQGEAPAPPAAAPPPPDGPAAPPAGGEAAPGALSIASVGNDLKFERDRLTASAGTQVTVVFKNNAQGLQHNWVLVKAGTEDAVATAGASAGPGSDWVPKGNPNVLASTKLIDGGKSGSVTFTTPAAGTYAFICSFPGHPITMRGVFEVSP